ncbi:hypothetical protein P5V15_012538 [Pogonomyrmex californicus]
MIITITTVLVLFILILLAYNSYVHRRNWKLINCIPGPSSYSIMNKALISSQKDLWKLMISIFGQNYPIFKIWYFFTPFVAIRHPDDIEVILKTATHNEKSFIYDIFRPLFNTGLITSGGAKWKSRRKILDPTFHFSVLQQFVDVFIKESEDMANSLKNTGDTVVEDLKSFISKHTLNALCETVMGISLQGLDSFQQQYRNIINQLTEIMVYRALRLWLYNDWVFLLTSKGRQQKRLVKIGHRFTQKIIAERKLYHEQINGQYLKTSDKNTSAEEDNSENITIKKRRLVMIDMLIAASREGHLTDSDIEEEINTFIAAGYETTTMTLCYILCLLAEHKDIQNRVREEINAVMHESGGKLTMQSLQKLSYLERCIKETLRLYPVVYIIARNTSEDVKLQSYLVPAGTSILISIYGVHRDPNYWPNPEIFDPDRFLPEKIQNQHPYSYLPFSAGPRNCIGQRFALLEMKSIITSLIYNFYLEPIEYLKDIPFIADITIRPAYPFRLKFIPITKTHIDI